jgi:hypothetical protein
MPGENTTAIVQRYQDELTGEAPAEPAVRPLLDRAFLRLQRLCATLLQWELNDQARRLDKQPVARELLEGQANVERCLAPSDRGRRHHAGHPPRRDKAVAPDRAGPGGALLLFLLVGSSLIPHPF